MADKRFMCHVVSEILIVVGIVFMFFREKRKMEARISELEKKISTMNENFALMQRTLNDKIQQSYMLSMPQPMFPIPQTFHVFESAPSVPKVSPKRTVSFEELVDINKNTSSIEIIDDNEIASELAELEDSSEEQKNNLEEKSINNK